MANSSRAASVAFIAVLCACGSGKGSVVAITVDAPDPLHEPESTPHLVWTGSELLLSWTRWTNGGYEMRLAALQLAAGALNVSANTAADPGNTDIRSTPDATLRSGRNDRRWPHAPLHGTPYLLTTFD